MKARPICWAPLNVFDEPVVQHPKLVSARLPDTLLFVQMTEEEADNPTIRDFKRAAALLVLGRRDLP